MQKKLKLPAMKFTDLKNLAERNEVKIDNTKDRKRTPPHYFESLRNAFAAYFHTFRTSNATLESYAMSTSTTPKKQLTILESQHLDVEHTVLAMVNFERFFELYMKEILRSTHPRLVQEESRHVPKSKKTWQLLVKIQDRSFVPRKTGRQTYTIAFRETLKRFYELVRYSSLPDKKSLPIVKKFTKVMTPYKFLSNDQHKATLELINWYRDRILHNGNSLPSLRSLDYFVTQHIVPVVLAIRNQTKNEYGDWWFFLETATGIDLLDLLAAVRIAPRNAQSSKQINAAVQSLLYIGHLKELGRSNLNMNWLMRRNLRATFEYNYHDPVGRGIRFAEIEKEKNSHARQIASCPCCSHTSLVIYRQEWNDIFNNNRPLNIDWVKCYTCDYHVRYNTGEPAYFRLHNERLFNRQFNEVATENIIQ